MARPLPRFSRSQEEAETAVKIARILLEVGEPLPARVFDATAGGDGRRLRGIPCHAKGSMGGAIPGTDPLRALLAKERRRQ